MIRPDARISRREFLGRASSAALLGTAFSPLARAGESPEIPFADQVPYGRPSAGRRWYKGNTHLHTIRSDGDAFPIEAALRFKKAGYNFICFTDHNVTATDPFRPLAVDSPAYGKKVSENVVSRFAEDFPGLELRREYERDGRRFCTSLSFEEIAAAVNERNRFLVISGNEVTAAPTGGNELHCNMLNLRTSCRARHLESVAACLDWMIGERDRILGHGSDTIFTLNHPLWVSYDVPPQLAVDHPSIRFFEVCNSGSMPRFNLPGPEFTHDKWWDVVNTKRALMGLPLLYAVGSDDIHGYGVMREGRPRAAGYVQVLSSDLSVESLFKSMYCGDFYASCGLELKNVSFDLNSRTLSVEVDPRYGDDCVISFIGSKRNVDVSVREIVSWEIRKGSVGAWLEKERHFNRHRTVERYSEDVGKVFKQVRGRKASYTMQPDDLYVRAKVVTSQGVRPENCEPTLPIAWTQPIVAKSL